MKMLTTAFVLLLASLGNDCNKKKSNHVLNLVKSNPYSKGFNPETLRRDSITLEKVLATYSWARRDTFNAKKMVFAKAFVQMVEVNKHRSDFDVYDYHYCEAIKTDTGLVIRLKQNAPFDGVGRFEGINVEFTLLGEDYKSRILHWSDTGMRPESKVFYDNLTIWGNTLEKGDTISGRVYLMANTQKERRQILKGSFYAIIW